MKRLLSFILCFSFLAGCSSPAASDELSSPKNALKREDTSAVSAAFDAFTEELFCSEISSNTINLHFTLSNPQAYGIETVPITLGEISNTSIAEANAFLENTQTALSAFDFSSLSLSQQLTYDILDAYLTLELSAADFTLYDELLRPSTGIQSQLPVLYEEYKFYKKQDIDDYLALIALTDNYFSQIIDFEKEKSAAGLFMSDFACNTIISQCKDFIADAKNHYLIQTFNHKIDAFPSLSDEERASYKSQNESLVINCILPAYETLAAALGDLLESGKNDKGLCYFADGAAYYEYLVSHNTGCSESVSELSDMILSQRYLDLTAATNLTNENPAAWEVCKTVSLTPMDSITALDLLQSQMLKHFPAPPSTNYTVSYIDECMESYMAPAFYITAPIDNYENNSIFINASTDTSSIHYFTTLAHEGFPGHLYQTVMSYEAGLPAIRSLLNFPGYIEGWATYVEMISYQYAGLDETVAEILSLNQSSLLSLYASTDIGIHYEGWSYTDTLDFWADYGITDEDALRDVYELIVEEPSHYLKYYVGYLKFLELKKTARETYGSNYSDVAFHKAVLTIGPAPFDILERYLYAYYEPLD